MKYSALFSLLACIGLTACQQNIETPKQVSEKYWQALKNGELVTARSLVATDTQSGFDDYVALPVDARIPLDEISFSTEHASVTTHIQNKQAATDSSRTDAIITFDTVLVLEDGQWKIDALRTQVPAPEKSPALADDDPLSDALQKNLDSMDEALKEGTEALNEFMREGSREMSDSLLKGMNKMNESLREAIEQMKQRREPQPPTPPPADDGDGDSGEGLI